LPLFVFFLFTRSIPPSTLPHVSFSFYFLFLLYHFINLRAATEVSSLPSTHSQARQGGRGREKGLQEAATMMTAKVEDIRKITTTNEWTTARRLLFIASVLSVFAFAAALSTAHAHLCCARVFWLACVVRCGCFVLLSSNSMSVSGCKCVCAMGQTRRRSIRQRLDTS
jgi:hypothetical protein